MESDLSLPDNTEDEQDADNSDDEDPFDLFDPEEAEQEESIEEEESIDLEEDTVEEQLYEPLEIDLSLPVYPEPIYDIFGCPMIPEANSVEYDFCALHDNLRDALFLFADWDNDGYVSLTELIE